MSEHLRRWSEDETVGKALIVAGVVFVVVKLLPASVVGMLRHAWPLVIVALGLLLIWRKPT